MATARYEDYPNFIILYVLNPTTKKIHKHRIMKPKNVPRVQFFNMIGKRFKLKRLIKIKKRPAPKRVINKKVTDPRLHGFTQKKPRQISSATFPQNKQTIAKQFEETKRLLDSERARVLKDREPTIISKPTERKVYFMDKPIPVSDRKLKEAAMRKVIDNRSDSEVSDAALMPRRMRRQMSPKPEKKDKSGREVKVQDVLPPLELHLPIQEELIEDLYNTNELIGIAKKKAEKLKPDSKKKLETEILKLDKSKQPLVLYSLDPKKLKKYETKKGTYDIPGLDDYKMDYYQLKRQVKNLTKLDYDPKYADSAEVAAARDLPKNPYLSGDVKAERGFAPKLSSSDSEKPKRKPIPYKLAKYAKDSSDTDEELQMKSNKKKSQAKIKKERQKRERSRERESDSDSDSDTEPIRKGHGTIVIKEGRGFFLKPTIQAGGSKCSCKCCHSVKKRKRKRGPTAEEKAEMAKEEQRQKELSEKNQRLFAEANPNYGKSLIMTQPQSGSGFTKGDAKTNVEIDDKMINFPEYAGCIARDEITEKILPKATKFGKLGFVLNLDKKDQPGSHWVSVYIDATKNGSHSVEYYNPLADPLPDDIRKDLVQLAMKMGPDNEMRLKVNKIKDQSDTTNNCSLFASKFLIDRFEGKPFREASRFVTNVGKGEKGIQEFKKEVWQRI